MNPGLPSFKPPADGVVDWLVANRDNVLVGAVVAAGIVLVMIGIRLAGQWLVARESESPHFGWKSVVGRVLAKTTISFMVMAAIDIVSTYAGPPHSAQRIVDIGFTIAFALQGAIWARELILALITRRAGDGTTETALGNATAIIRVLVSIALFAIAIVVILDNIGVNVTALVAGLGIGGIAIGLAAQGIFSDLFAALSILFDKPFKRGDTIRFGTTVGRVERIGLKTTRMRSLTGEQVIMANTKLLESEIHNLADGRSRRNTITFGVKYETDAAKLEAIAGIAEEVANAVPGCKLVRCTLHGFGTSSLDYQLMYEARSIDQDVLADDRDQIMMGLIRRFRKQGIEFAYPVQIGLVQPVAPAAKPRSKPRP